MKKIIPTISFFVVGLLFLPKVLQAKPSFGPVIVGPSNGRASVVIPERAAEVAPGVFNLGTSIDDGKVVQGYAIVNYKWFARSGATCGNNICEPGENPRKCPIDCGGGEPDGSSCYGFIAKGAKWRVVEPYLINPLNEDNLDEAFVVDNLVYNVAKWESAAATDILGDESSTADVLEADLDNPDGQNEVYFADIDSPGAIGVTIIWGIFRGPPSQRSLVEWDQVYDDYDYDWSSTGDSGKMDFENVATHELGHSFGLADLYENKCSEQTMYGYADFGEISKRTLEVGDIAGIKKLYQ